MRGYLRIFGIGILVSFVTTLEASRFACAVVEFWDVVAPRAGGVVRSVGRTPVLLPHEEMAVARVAPPWMPKVWMPGVVDAESAAGMRLYNRGGMLRRTPTLLRPYHIEPRLPGLVVARWMSTKAQPPIDEDDHSFADPTDDISFKALFRRPENKDLLRNFLNNVLDYKGDDEIVELSVHDPDISPKFSDMKRYSLDVFCTDRKGSQYIVEMEKDAYKQHGKAGFFKRLQCYTGSIYSEQIEVGESYDKLKPVICIVLTNTKVFAHPERYLSRHLILDEETKEHHFRDMSWVVVEIPNFTKEEESLTELEQWMYMFRHAKNHIKIPSQIQSPVVRKAYQALDKSLWSKEERTAYKQAQLKKRDEENTILVAEDRGEERTLIRLAKTWSRKGKPVTQIAEDLEQPEDWVREALSTTDTPAGDERA